MKYIPILLCFIVLISSCEKTDDKLTEKTVAAIPISETDTIPIKEKAKAPKPVKYCKVKIQAEPLAHVFNIKSFKGEYQYLQKPLDSSGVILDIYHKGKYIKSIGTQYSGGLIPKTGKGYFNFQIVDYSKTNIDHKRKSGFGIFLQDGGVSTKGYLNEDEFYFTGYSGREIPQFIEEDGFIAMHYFVFNTRSQSGTSSTGKAMVKELLTKYPDSSIIVIKTIYTKEPLTYKQLINSGAIE